MESDGPERYFPEGKEPGEYPCKDRSQQGERDRSGDFAAPLQYLIRTSGLLKESNPEKEHDRTCFEQGAFHETRGRQIEPEPAVGSPVHVRYYAHIEGVEPSLWPRRIGWKEVPKSNQA